MMDVKETGKQIRQVLTLLLDGGFVMPIILTSIDRFGSLMLAEYTPTPGEKEHWHCEMLAERMKSELFEPPINMLFVDARGEVACSMQRESGRFCTDHRVPDATTAFKPIGAIFPRHIAPVVRGAEDGEREIVTMSWG